MGWGTEPPHALHPRALCRLPEDTVQLIVTLLNWCEVAGAWFTQVGVVIIVLLPKPDGGFRPIGLLPTIVRV